MAGRKLEEVVVNNPFFLRTVSPAPGACEGRRVEAIRRLGKRIALGFEHDVWLVIHLMIAGRLQWRERRGAPRKRDLAAFAFESGQLLVTEAGSKRRAWLKVFASSQAVGEEDPGGLEPLTCSAGEFAHVLGSAKHTLKRALTHPRLFSGIGNAYSDEILHRARLSPVTLAHKLSHSETERLFQATQDVLEEWRERLIQQTGDSFPTKVTAFRPEMAVHGKYGQPCPVCGSPVQRIRYSQRETNYCARCQTGGKVLRDRSLSLLLKEDWPNRIEQWE